MSEWIKHKISALIESKILVIGDGYRAKNSELSTDEGLPFARAGDINDGFQLENAECLAPENLHKAGEKISQKGDALFTSKGTVGRVAFVTDETPDFVYSPQLTWWRVIDTQQIHPEFLYCWMRGQEFISQINSFSGQTDMAAYVSLKDQRQMMYITLPKIEEQKAITAVISCLDRKIENLRRQNETLERIAQTLFKHWFVDFEFPNEDGKPYKSSGGEMVRSELGEIPAGWRVGRLGNLFALNYGKSLTLENRVSGQYPVVGSSGIVGSHKSYLVNAPGIVIGRKGTIGQVIWLEENFYPIDTTFYVEDIFGCNGLYFYYFLLKRQNFQRLTSDSAVPGLNRDMAYSVEIVVPKIKYIDKFNTLIKAAFNKVNLNQKQIETLTKIRDVLLPQLMSGKLRITE